MLRLRKDGSWLTSNVAHHLACTFSTQPTEEKASPTHAMLTPEELLILKSKRVKGFGRKITLRAINRNLVRRLAKRATIGIPLLGMYFAVRVLYNDTKQAFNMQNDPFIRKAYGVAATIDMSDLAAQLIIIAGMTSSFFFQEYNIFPTLAEMGPVADKVSLSAALISSSIGTYCEVKKEEEAELRAEAEAAAEDKTAAKTAATSTATSGHN